MFLTWLLIAQAALTALTGLVLFVAPGAIPASFGLKLTPDAYLLCYFYGAIELSLAVTAHLPIQVVCITASPASAARSAPNAVSPCKRPVAMTLAAAA